MSFEYKAFSGNISEEWILAIIITEYKKKIDAIKTHELFENINLLPPYIENIKKCQQILSEMISYCEKENLNEIFSRKDLLYPYVCKAIKFYLYEIKKNESNIKQILGDSLQNSTQIEGDINILEKLKEKYCLDT